jgi:hypothetical protein
MRGYGGRAPSHLPARRMTWRAAPIAELRLGRGVALLGGDIAGTTIRRDPASLLLDAQCLTLGRRGYLGLNRGCLGPS